MGVKVRAFSGAKAQRAQYLDSAQKHETLKTFKTFQGFSRRNCLDSRGFRKSRKS